MKFKIPVCWLMSRTFIVKANSIEEAIDKVYDDVDGKYPVKGGKYVDDSFVVDNDCCEGIDD